MSKKNEIKQKDDGNGQLDGGFKVELGDELTEEELNVAGGFYEKANKAAGIKLSGTTVDGQTDSLVGGKEKVEN